MNGSGYTNHCSQCLWSKHVDINPGDRLALCNGSMEPVDMEVVGGTYTILHHCTKCGFERKNKTVHNDNIDAVIKLSSQNNER